ncbi:MAG: hypothetical protein IKP48_10475 [Bacteroidaceae bacterium]|nr:hypothetical protein [Bacteroidaceae bacterium]
MTCWCCLAQAQQTAQLAQQINSQRIADVEAGLTYGESMFVISNYSCLNGFTKETASVSELLGSQVEGFYFYLKEDVHSKQVVMRKPDGTFVPFVTALRDIRQSLNANPYQFITLFLDFNVELDLTKAFTDAGLVDFLFEYGQRTNWPTLQEMKAAEKRLVAFEVQDHVNSPAWLHPMTDLVIHTDPDWGNSMNSIELQEDKMKKNLTIFTGFKNVEAMQFRSGNLYETSRYTPYLVNAVRDTWINEGRVPNFILIDRYGEWVGATMRNLRSFNLVFGAVVSRDELVNYVNWEGMNNATTGLFCFPLESGLEMMLSPLVPGFRVQPEKLYATGNQKRVMMQTFNATPVNIDQHLELWLPFNGEMENASAKDATVTNQGVEFNFDTSHGQVAYFNSKSKINLPTSQDLLLRDHDFTVQVWLKIPKYEEGKQDYCIIGSKTSAYQQALHLLVRNKKPYMGFYNNDIEGRTTIEPNKWYNLTWRFNKQNGEQAIFVNGKLDAIATGRPGYMGSDSLYVGYTSINQSYYTGMMDNLAVWSRVLSEKEILGLSNQVIEVQVTPTDSFWQLNGWLLAALVGLILAILALYWYIRWRAQHHLLKQNGTLPEIDDRVMEQQATVGLVPTVKNSIHLFGPFLVIDKDGEDITTLFTPKLKRLFFLLLVSSVRGKHGINGVEMNDFIWGKDSKNAKSLRSVSVLKLRKILERLNKVEIAFHANKYVLVMSRDVYCDYMQCLAMIEGKRIESRKDFERFFEIVQRGEAFAGESFNWLDDDKSYVCNTAVDVMTHFISTFQLPAEADEVIHVANKILENDPCNEEALSYLTRALISQNNFKQARYAYESFCTEYAVAYGEPFNMSFDELVKEAKVIDN